MGVFASFASKHRQKSLFPGPCFRDVAFLKDKSGFVMYDPTRGSEGTSRDCTWTLYRIDVISLSWRGV
jgi:hypothetical protein